MKTSFLSIALLGFAATASAQSEPAPVTTADLAFAGVLWRADTLALLRILGQPARRGTYKWPDAEEPMSAWIYPGLEFDLAAGDGVLIAVVVGPTVQTTRGVRIGDTAGKVRRLYGDPTENEKGTWEYDAEDDGGVALMFTIVDGKVTDIMAGTIPGMD